LLAFVLCGGLVVLSGTRATAQTGSAAPARLDAPFTLSVPTPHVAWGKPLAGNPIRAFVVPSVSEGRTLVELAERLDFRFDTVMIDDAWDVNTWTVGTDANYEARNYKLAYKYLEEDLAKPTTYDVIVLPSLFGWNRLPQAVREAIRKRVEQGTGLVLIHPTTGLPAPDDPKVEGPLNDFAPSREVAPGEELWDLSPLVGVLSDRIDARGFREIRPDATASGAWKQAGQHFITANLAIEDFPFGAFKHYRYRLGKDASVLAVGPEGEPVIAVKDFGKGRVVAFGYVNTGLSPMIPKNLNPQSGHGWEYFYSMLCRAIVWAARREPALSLGPLAVAGNGTKLTLQVENASTLPAAEIMAETRNEWGEKEGTSGVALDTLKPGSNSAQVDLPSSLSAGRHFTDVVLTARGVHYDWGTATFDLPKTDEIESVSTDRDFYSPGDKIQVTFKTRRNSPGKFRVELLDNRGRLLSRQTSGGPQGSLGGAHAVLDAGNYSTNIGWVRVTLLEPGEGKDRVVDRQQARVNFAARQRAFGAYELILPWYGPPTDQPWTPTLDEQFRKLGVSAVEAPERNFKLISEVQTPGLGVYWHYRQKYLEQKDKFLATGDKAYLVREPDLASEEWLEKLRRTVRESMEKEKPYRPLAYYLADESSLTAYGDPLDFSWSKPTLAKFRDWLKTQYSGLDALNTEWETRFMSWDEVQPLTTQEAQTKGNYAGWMDHRTFMEQVFAHAVEAAAQTVKQEDPGGLPSISGTQAPGPSNAVNWYRLDQIVDYLQPYSDDDQDELHRSMRPGQILTGFTGYENHGKALRYQLWHRLLHGQTGASLFWHYTALNADLTLTEQGRDLSDTIREFRNEGLALLLRGAERENCGIAVHYSLLSVRGEWITDGHIAPHEVSNGDATSPHLKRFHQNRSAWLQALDDGGYQYDFLTTEQIEAGKLATYKALILPDSLALSDAEVNAMRKFVEGGGLLISDAETGLMDGHARWQPVGRLDDVKGVQRIDMRSSADIAEPVQLRVTLSGGETLLDVLPAGASLRTTTGRPGAAAKDALFLVDNPFGAGRSISLNFWMTDYPRLRNTPAQRARLAMLRDYLSLAGVQPLANVRRASGEPLACSEMVGFRKGVTRYLAILPEPDCADRGPSALALPAPQFVYDLRAHRLLGRLSRVTGTLAEGEPLLYALQPAPVGRLSIQAGDSGKGERALAPAKASLKAGDTARFQIRLTARPTEIVPETAAHVEVVNPAGKIVDYYGADIPISNGAAEFAVPLALDDLPGTWRVTVREPFTHQTASATFVVTR